MHLRLSFLLAGALACSAAVSYAQAPRINKIDPPNWWSGLPDPMLLVHGEDLIGARFAVEGRSVAITRTEVSANGHWAFLWLRTADARPQRLWVTANNGAGEARTAFALEARDADAPGHQGFSSADAMYLIMTDRFADGHPQDDPRGDDRAAPRGWHGGDFAGIEQHLDYLKQLGVTTLWLTPVVSNGAMPQSYHGYAATDLYAVDRHFGTLKDYKQLSAALHARGMKLVIDLVANHVGVEHPWVADPPAPEWFHGTLADHSQAEHDFNELIDPHAPPQAWRNIVDGWFTDAMPDLNQENPLVAQYLIDNALWWVETADLDGIRLDTFPYVSRAYWHEFHAVLHGVYPRLTTVGEVFNRDPDVTSFFAGGATRTGADGTFDTGVDTVFDFPLQFALRDVLAQGAPMTELEAVLRKDALYPHPERLVTFIGNHDTTRFYTEDGRSAARLKLALGLVLTLRGMPQIYSGDEIGMAGGKDPDNRRDFPGGFPGDPHDAFTPAGRTALEQEVFHWTSGLLAFRQAHAELKTGVEQDLFADADGFAFVRAADGNACAPRDPKERLLIVVNKSEQAKTVDLPVKGTVLAGCTRFVVDAADPSAVPRLQGGTLEVNEPAQSMTIYGVK